MERINKSECELCGKIVVEDTTHCVKGEDGLDLVLCKYCDMTRPAVSMGCMVPEDARPAYPLGVLEDWEPSPAGEIETVTFNEGSALITRTDGGAIFLEGVIHGRVTQFSSKEDFVIEEIEHVRGEPVRLLGLHELQAMIHKEETMTVFNFNRILELSEALVETLNQMADLDAEAEGACNLSIQLHDELRALSKGSPPEEVHPSTVVSGALVREFVINGWPGDDYYWDDFEESTVPLDEEGFPYADRDYDLTDMGFLVQVGEDEHPSFADAFHQWLKSQTSLTLAIQIPREKEDEVRRAISQADGKVL